MNERMVDVLIVVAADGEDSALMRVDQGSRNQWSLMLPIDLPTKYPLPVRIRQFQTTQGRPFRVALTRAASQRGGSTAHAATLLAAHFRPLVLAMAGVCAGRPGWTSLGDVVVADRVYRYSAGRLVTRSSPNRDQHIYLPDLATYNLHASIKQIAEDLEVRDAEWVSLRPLERERQEQWLIRSLLESWPSPLRLDDPDRRINCPQWEDVLASLWEKGMIQYPTLELTGDGKREAEMLALKFPDGLPPVKPVRIHVGPIGTGDALQARTGIWDDLERDQAMVRALDMEASEVGLVAELQDVPRVLVAKGVMDYADPERQYGFRDFAARASGEIIITILRRYLDTMHEFADVQPTASGLRKARPGAGPENSVNDEVRRSLQTFLYISVAKLNMLLAQLSEDVISGMGTELGMSDNAILALQNGVCDARSRYDALRLVESYLRLTRQVGEVDEPSAYFSGELDMKWGVYDERLLYFGGESSKTIVGIGGSPHHLIGSVGSSHSHSHSATPTLMATLTRELWADKGRETPRKGVEDRYSVAMAVDLATTQMDGPHERMRFLARKLAFFNAQGHDAWRQDMNILLGTPLYVCTA